MDKTPQSRNPVLGIRDGQRHRLDYGRLRDQGVFREPGRRLQNRRRITRRRDLVARAGNPGSLRNPGRDRNRRDRPSARQRGATTIRAMAADAMNALAVPLALGLLGYALVRNANLFTVAACAFVVGSCLLRGAANFPLPLKLGGLALSLGGLALAGAGVMVLAVQLFGPGGTGLHSAPQRSFPACSWPAAACSPIRAGASPSMRRAKPGTRTAREAASWRRSFPLPAP